MNGPTSRWESREGEQNKPLFNLFSKIGFEEKSLQIEKAVEFLGKG